MTLPYLNELAADTVPFGAELAGKVADKLDEGHSPGYFHRDYCGMGSEKKDKRLEEFLQQSSGEF